MYFRWKQAIQQLSVKPHLQHIKSCTSKESAHGLSDWSLEKNTFYCNQTELIYWPLLTLSSEVYPNSMNRLYQSSFLLQDATGHSCVEESGFAWYSWHTCSWPGGSWHFLSLKHASCLPVFLVSRVINFIYKSTFFYQMKSLNCQEISKKSKLAACCWCLFLPSSLQQNKHQWRMISQITQMCPRLGDAHMAGCWDSSSEDPGVFPAPGGKGKERCCHLQLDPDIHPVLQTSRSLPCKTSDFQRCFTPQIPGDAT